MKRPNWGSLHILFMMGLWVKVVLIENKNLLNFRNNGGIEWKSLLGLNHLKKFQIGC